MTTAAQVLIALVDTPHFRADAVAAGAVAAVALLLKPTSDDEVATTEEVAAILLSKLVLEPDTHVAIAKGSTITTLVCQPIWRAVRYEWLAPPCVRGTNGGSMPTHNCATQGEDITHT